MRGNSISKTVYYRRCTIGGNEQRSLQQLLTAAFEKVPRPGDRLEPLNTQSSELRGIGLHFNERSSLCGFMTSFERGAAQPVISDDPSAASLRLSALSPPEPAEGQAPSQYIPGVLYFVVFENHLAFVASHAIRSSALEAHLDWLLKSKTSVIDATIPFALSGEAHKATREKILRSHVKAISFGQPLMSEVTLAPSGHPTAPPPTRGANQKQRKAFRPGGRMLRVVRELFDDGEAFESLGLDEVFDSNLEIWIEIRYPKRKRSHAENAVQLLDTLALALRDSDGDDVSLMLADGNRVSGRQLKLSGQVQAPVRHAGLPDERELLKEMVAWLRDQIATGAIDP